MATIDDKRDHVRRARQERDHVCHYPGCGKQCKPAFWGCRSCWFKLPKFLRDKVWAAYQPGQEITGRPSREYVEVAREVQEWIASNDPDAVRRQAVLIEAARRKAAEGRQAGLFPED